MLPGPDLNEFLVWMVNAAASRCCGPSRTSARRSASEISCCRAFATHEATATVAQSSTSGCPFGSTR
jgi:hypothetical protein